MRDDLKKKKNAGRKTSQNGKRLADHTQEAPETQRRISTAATAVQERPAAEDRHARMAKPSEAPACKAASEKAAKQTGVIEKLCAAFTRWKESDSGSESPFLRLYRAAAKETKRAKRRWRHIAREKKAQRFPESERVPIQLLLFGWSMLPMAGSLAREAMLGRRRRAVNKAAHMMTRFERRKVHPVAFLGVAGCIAVAALFCSFYTVGTTVIYDGEAIAAVPSKAAAEDARESLERRTAQTLGQQYTIDDSLIQYSSGLLRRQDVVDEATFEEDLSEEIGLVTPAYCLYVDGELIGATPYEGALEELLEQLKTASAGAETISISFAEDVEIKHEYVPTEQVMNLGYLAETLYSTKTAEVTYEVKKGDTWSQIANSHDLTSKELLALNPGYNINKLQIGEVLTLSASVPYLTMTVVERERYVDDIPYEIEYTDTANLYKGDYKVTAAGAYGAADVVANVTYVNGEEVQRDILSSVTLKEPVTEQQLRGTKDRPTWHSTGTFRWPIIGRVTSRFGGRSSPGGVGSTNHKGIDIAGRRGAPVYAADGGTVTYAGWMGGYGYLVRIKHTNGYETYYGHNSSLTVSVGDKVYKGQQIARVGSTGNSTGNHCHFEVRYKGVARNPMNYLP